MNYYFQKLLICITFLTKRTKKEEFNRRPWGMLSMLQVNILRTLKR